MGWFRPRLSYWLQQERHIQQNSLIFCPDQDSFAVLPGSGQLYCCWDQNEFYWSVWIRTVLLFCWDQDSFTVLSGSGQLYCSVTSEGQLYCPVWIRRTALLFYQDPEFYCSVRIRTVSLFCQDHQDSFIVLSGSKRQIYSSVRFKKTVLLFCWNQKDSFTALSRSEGQLYCSVRIRKTALHSVGIRRAALLFCLDKRDSFSLLSGSA